ncbi:MAG: glycoside hydrolase family 27 protein [Synoicihabitans sp.]
MGWNSFDCYGSAITEAEFRANVDVMAEVLKPHGWEYAVVDFCWSHPDPGPCHNPHQGVGFCPMLHCDEQGRLVPAPNRFPSAADGAGFKPLADYVHGKGLKFGIHIMRGIPHQVAFEDMLVCDRKVRASDIALLDSTCTWLNHMRGVDVSKPEGQAYYDSLFALYAEWGVDFVKVDDILADGHPDSEGPYHAAEIEAIGRAIEKCGRPMVLSLSPGDAPKAKAEHVANHASMWRMSSDFWDDWKKLKRMFELTHWWTSHRRPGRWPDADMLPLGRLSKRGPKGPERNSWFTAEEQKTLMTLWTIFGSPLMFGGALVDLDDATTKLITNRAVNDIIKFGRDGAQLLREDDFIVWTASDSRDDVVKYVALFNLGDESTDATFDLTEHGLPINQATDLWSGANVAVIDGAFRGELSPHGCIYLELK